MGMDYRRTGPFGKIEPVCPASPANDPPAAENATSGNENPWWALVPDVEAISAEDQAEELENHSPSDSAILKAVSSAKADIATAKGDAPIGMVEELETSRPKGVSAGSEVVNPFHRKTTTSQQPFRRIPKEKPAPKMGKFFPPQPKSLHDAGLTDLEMHALILKFLLSKGISTGHGISEQVRLPYRITLELLQQLRSEQLIVYRNLNSVSDYEYHLTDKGIDRARRYYQASTYHGAAPVPIEDYIASVEAQSISFRRPGVEDVKRAFSELILSDEVISQIGQAIHSGHGMFLFGPPGNGKSSIAERITDTFGDTVWIPRAINAWGEIIRLYDPNNHQAVNTWSSDDERVDQRWIQVVRPTVVVGGELRMENLEVTSCSYAGISEAPLQLKSNCGTLVIDDFGRQQISPSELLNRWIIPLENRCDFLTLQSGRKIQVPFDQLIIFSTNLEPRDLVEEAFLRRIPYKIEIPDPNEEQFFQLFLAQCRKQGIGCEPEMVEYLMEEHFRKHNRSLRFCHPRDLLRQIRNYCSFHHAPLMVTKTNLDMAVKTYFSII